LGKKLGCLRVLGNLDVNEEEQRDEGLGSVSNCKDAIFISDWRPEEEDDVTSSAVILPYAKQL
jgi:hypothetical protein